MFYPFSSVVSFVYDLLPFKIVTSQLCGGSILYHIPFKKIFWRYRMGSVKNYIRLMSRLKRIDGHLSFALPPQMHSRICVPLLVSVSTSNILRQPEGENQQELSMCSVTSHANTFWQGTIKSQMHSMKKKDLMIWSVQSEKSAQTKLWQTESLIFSWKRCIFIPSPFLDIFSVTVFEWCIIPSLPQIPLKNSYLFVLSGCLIPASPIAQWFYGYVSR